MSRPQLPVPTLPGPLEQPPNDEDCLELNIYTPAADGEKRPVMMWFYGGSFTIGSAGGHSVGCPLTSPEAEDLFQRAILQSSSGWGLRSPKWAEEVTSKLMAELGTTTVEQFQAIDRDTILAAQARRDSGDGGPRSMGVAAFPSAPSLDGVVLRGAVLGKLQPEERAMSPSSSLTLETRSSFAAMGVLPELDDEEQLAANS
jgi:carboxylesterase type B